MVGSLVTVVAVFTILLAKVAPQNTDTGGDVVVVSQDVCNMAVDEGSSAGCDLNSTEAWYYRPEMDDCNYFIYAGCGGNKNRFRRLSDCEKTCQTCPYINCPQSCNTPTRDKNNCIKCTCTKGQRLSICSKPLERGNGRALMPRWGWDTKMKSCRNFAYGGLPGNDNNFSTEKECEEFCSYLLKY